MSDLGSHWLADTLYLRGNGACPAVTLVAINNVDARGACQIRCAARLRYSTPNIVEKLLQAKDVALTLSPTDLSNLSV